jgi:hypothetical protein|tara:strand:- start:608 stop:799 length:192 start_codon:yes stop_codon:yes gene_type:complete
MIAKQVKKQRLYVISKEQITKELDIEVFDNREDANNRVKEYREYYTDSLVLSRSDINQIIKTI